MVFINIYFFEHSFCAVVLHFKTINRSFSVLFFSWDIRQIDLLLIGLEIFSNFGKWSIKWSFEKVICTVLKLPTSFLGIIHFAFIALAPSGHHWALHTCISCVYLWVIKWLLVPFPTLSWRGSLGGFMMLNRNLHSHPALVLKVSLLEPPSACRSFFLSCFPFFLPALSLPSLPLSSFLPFSLLSFSLVSFFHFFAILCRIFFFFKDR